MLSKQQIRMNREKMRNKMKETMMLNDFDLHITLSENPENLDRNFQHNQNSPQTMDSIPRRRLLSEDFRSFQTLGDLKETHDSESFDKLFILKQKLGQGVESVVYKCEQRKTGDVYAVKIIRSSDLETILRIKNRYRIKKSLDNNSIIKAHYLFLNRKQSTVHMVCELCEYPSLNQEVKRSTGMRQAKASSIINQILTAVHYLHVNGVCHRDLKPDNIMYDKKTGRVKLIDFQIARMKRYKHEKLLMWTATGTPHYKAPEMFAGEYDQKIDVWAVGVIAFQLLTGRLPFFSEFEHQLIRSIRENQINYQNYNLSPFAVDFLKKCLQKSPDKRWTAKQALSSPFILKNMDVSSISNNSPNQRKTSSLQKRQPRKRKLTLEVYGKSLCQDSILQQLNILAMDIGIRHCQK